MNKYILLSLLLFISFTTNSEAQKKESKRWWAGAELMEGYTFKPSNSDNGFLSYLNNNNNTAAAFHFIAGYYLYEKFSLGLGIGFMGYNRESEGYFPVFVDFRYHPLRDHHNLILNGQIGTSISSQGDNYKAIYSTDLSVGYLLKWKKFCFVPALGLNYTKFNAENTVSENHINRKTIYFKLGTTL